MSNKYMAAKGAMFNDEQAQVIGERFEELAEENNGYVTDEIVVTDAKYKKSLLNEYFEWDDGRAAGLYRRRQARDLLGHIEVVIKTNGDEESVKAFHNVVILKEKEKISERVYMPLIKVLSDAEYHQQIIEKALAELEGWRKRYAQYQELNHFIKMIEEIKYAG